MHGLATLIVMLAVVAVVARADDSTTTRDTSLRPRVDAIVPVPPREHERLHFFGRRDHHLVPGTVTINAAPYVCDPHRLRFKERDDFVAHLRTVHELPPEAISDQLLVRDGRVHFVGK